MKILLKVLSLGLIFGAPIAHIVYFYSTETETVVKTSIGIIPMIIIMAIALLLVSFIYNNIKATLDKHPFGFLSIIFYGVVGLAFVTVLMFWFGSILGTAQANFDAFKDSFTRYIRTMQFIIGYVLLGLAFATFGWFRHK